MNPWIAKAVILVASVVMVVIRAPHGRRSRGVKVARSCKGPREVVLLTFAWMGFLVPLIWVVSPFFSFAEYPLRPWPFGAGVLCLVAGLWWFHRSHSDLGTYWSVTLELRENHRLITQGVYRYVRHPMYAALFLLLHRPSAHASELGCRAVVLSGVWNSLCTSYRCRGKDDARGIRRRIRGVHDKDKAARTRNLVIGRAGYPRPAPPLVRGTSSSCVSVTINAASVQKHTTQKRQVGQYERRKRERHE